MSTLVYPTMLDIVKMRGNDPTIALVEEIIQEIPELRVITSRPIKGTSFKSLVRTALPVVGFRGLNQGAVQGKSAYEQRNFECFAMNPRWNADKMMADANEDGAQAYIAMEGIGMVTAAGQSVARQMYYGITNDAKGFPGLASFVDSSLVVDATGSTANGCTSVWAIKASPMDVQLVMGGDGTFDLSDSRIESVLDSDGNPFTAYVQEIASWLGMSVLSKWSVGRICNLSLQSGKTLDDGLLADLIGKFPDGKRPTALFMHRQSRTQLQKSRTATSPTGAEVPVPTSYEDIPIYASESVSITEAVVS